jgi:hypothetical protein
MALLDILKSLHGRQYGLSRTGELVINRGAMRDQDQEVIERSICKEVTSAQVLALFATPIEIIPAPGAGRCVIPRKWMVYKPAGTAYAGIAATEDLVLKYTNASGVQVASPIEATGFLDQATAQTAWAGMKGSADNATPASALAVANAAVVLHMLVGEIITGNTSLFVKVWYDEYPMVLAAD